MRALKYIATNEYELKTFLLSALDAGKLNDLVDFINHQLAITFLKDEEILRLYQLKIRVAMNWFQMGYKELAKKSFVELLADLFLERSKDGTERMLQAGNFTGSIIARIPTQKGLFNVFQKKEEENPLAGLTGDKD